MVDTPTEMRGNHDSNVLDSRSRSPKNWKLPQIVDSVRQSIQDSSGIVENRSMLYNNQEMATKNSKLFAKEEVNSIMRAHQADLLKGKQVRNLKSN